MQQTGRKGHGRNDPGCSHDTTAMRRIIYILAAGITLAGCADDQKKDQGPPPIPGPRTAYADPVSLAGYPRILLRDGLDQSLMLLGEPVVLAASPTIPMEVRVRLRNTLEVDQTVQYRYRFYGRYREPLSEDAAWQTLELGATHDRTFAANSVSLEAVDWELEVRRFH